MLHTLHTSSCQFGEFAIGQSSLMIHRAYTDHVLEHIVLCGRRIVPVFHGVVLVTVFDIAFGSQRKIMKCLKQDGIRILGGVSRSEALLNCLYERRVGLLDVLLVIISIASGSNEFKRLTDTGYSISLTMIALDIVGM